MRTIKIHLQLFLFLFLFLFMNFSAFAQNPEETEKSISSVPNSSKDSSKYTIVFGGALESYYTYDLGQPTTNKRPGFIYSHNRHNEVNINLAYIKGTFSSEKARATIALMGGTYSNANLAAEPGVLKNIYEANAGFKLLKKHNLWFDMGVFPSHLGFESAHGPSCWSLTRSILADNSPYFESGAKFTYISSNNKWLFSALLLNGWQRIQRVNGNSTPAIGTQITWSPNQNVILNSSTFTGNDKPDSAMQMRYFHNFYGIFKIHPKFWVTTGFDIGAEQVHRDSASYNLWYSPIVILKFNMNKKVSISGRAEYYFDDKGVIISTGSPNGFQTFGYSLNFDYSIHENVIWRLEGRSFNSKDKIFILDGKPSHENYFFTTSLAITF